jgi:hypothetical protein
MPQGGRRNRKKGNSATKYGWEMNCRLIRAKKNSSQPTQNWKPLFVQRFLSKA